MGRPNILLIILDAVRAKNLSLYGHGNKTTPFLDKFSKSATVYHQARSPGIWSLPSHASMFTGYDVPEHQITSYGDRLEPGNSIWEELRDDYGYETGVFSTNIFITTSEWGLNAGFDHVVTRIPNRSYPFEGADPHVFTAQYGTEMDHLDYVKYALQQPNKIGTLLNGLIYGIEQRDLSLPIEPRKKYSNSAKLYTEKFLDWIDSTRSPWAACINFVDAHAPYKPQENHDLWGGQGLHDIHDSLGDNRWDFYSGRRPWWQRRALEALYDGCIHQMDEQVERIVSNLSKSDDRRDTLIVITSDHGEGFGEKSRINPKFRTVNHHSGLHEVNLHVPLIVKFPGQAESMSIGTTVSLTEFPNVVRAAISAEQRAEKPFVREKPVLVYSCDDRLKHDKNTMEDFKGSLNLDLFKGEAIGTYSIKDDNVITIVKYANWQGHSSKIEIFDSQCSRITSNSVEYSEIEEKFWPHVEEVSIKNRSNEPIDSNTKQQLNALGYM